MDEPSANDYLKSLKDAAGVAPIDDAYGAAIRKAYDTLIEGLIQADGVPSEAEETERRFRRAVGWAKLAREKAIQILEEST